MKQGNNYDIQIQIQVSAMPAKPANSSVSIRMTTQKTGGDLAALPTYQDFFRNDFNSTTFDQKYEFKDDFSSNADASFNFEVTASKNLVNIVITMKLYENPRRTLTSIARTIGIALLIPGGLILAGVCCLNGNIRKRRK